MASKQVPLPEEPWRAIVFNERQSPQKIWEGEISVKLMGNYTSGDSLMLQKAIATMNELVQTVDLSFSKGDRGDIEFYFMDSTNRANYKNIININESTKYSWNLSYAKNRPTHLNLALQLALVPDSLQQNFLTNNLILALYPNYLNDGYAYKSGRKVMEISKSVFNYHSRENDQPFYSEISSFDRQLIQTVYAVN
ncbi:MAG: hypothetical protein PF444_10010, partial [Bacteroidales bacterium]|nr:hypothetical protein [Bacteroidales bacterium]